MCIHFFNIHKNNIYFVILYTIYISLAAHASKTYAIYIYAKHIALIQSSSQVRQGAAIHFQTAQNVAASQVLRVL